MSDNNILLFLFQPHVFWFYPLLTRFTHWCRVFLTPPFHSLFGLILSIYVIFFQSSIVPSLALCTTDLAWAAGSSRVYGLVNRRCCGLFGNISSLVEALVLSRKVWRGQDTAWASRGRDTHGELVFMRARRLTFSCRIPRDGRGDVWVINGAKNLGSSSHPLLLRPAPLGCFRVTQLSSDTSRRGIGSAYLCSSQVEICPQLRWRQSSIWTLGW